EERRRAEEFARSNEERLALALSAADMGTWDWDIAGQKITLSETTRRLCGITDDEPPPKLEYFYSLVHPEDQDNVQLAMKKALELGLPYEAEFRVVANGVTR